jgi:hypothetical protein
MRVFLSLATLLALGCAGTSPTEPDPIERFNPGLLEVGSARVQVGPAGPELVIKSGGVPCLRVGQVTQERRGSSIDVRVESYWNAPVCILLLKTFEHTVVLEGPFPTGDYVVRVNGVEVRFRI